MYETVLALLKYDLSFRNASRDEYLLCLIESVVARLASYGVKLNLEFPADAMFLSDWCAFEYRNRLKGDALPSNLRLRLNDRIVDRRSAYVSQDTV